MISPNMTEEWKTYNDDFTFSLNIIEPIKDFFTICFLK